MDEQEPQVPPAVPKARELGLAAAWVVLDRHLIDGEALLGGADDHLRRELHAGGAQIEAGQDVAAQGPHPAVGVLDAGAEEEVQHAGEHRVAHVAVQPRHRARVDVVHPVAHDHLGAAVQPLDEPGDVLEVVGEVGVEHHDVLALGRGEPGQVGAAVAAARFVDHAGAGRLGERGTAVLGAVVGNDHLAAEVVLLEHGSGAGDALLDVRRLVQTRDHHRHEHVGLDRRRGLPHVSPGDFGSAHHKREQPARSIVAHRRAAMVVAA